MGLVFDDEVDVVVEAVAEVVVDVVVDAVVDAVVGTMMVVKEVVLVDGHDSPDFKQQESVSFGHSELDRTFATRLAAATLQQNPLRCSQRAGGGICSPRQQYELSSRHNTMLPLLHSSVTSCLDLQVPLLSSQNTDGGVCVGEGVPA